MTKNPKRPRDLTQWAQLMADLATKEAEICESTPTRAQEFARQGGLKGGRARVDKLAPERRAENCAIGSAYPIWKW